MRALDAAFLRHGRFDYVLPIGLPDDEARTAIWSRYVPADSIADVDIAALVEASDGFTPADIEYAARRASQEALARALRAGEAGDAEGSRHRRLPPRARRDARDGLEADVEGFLADIDTFARL